MRDGPGPKAARGRNAGLPSRDVSDIVKEQHSLPKSAVAIRFLQIREDPFAHFMPTKTTDKGTFICLAPPGIAPELAELFLRPLNAVKRPRDSSPSKRSKKRKLDDNADEEDVEQVRRAASLALSITGRSDVNADQTLDFGADQPNFEDFQMEVPDMLEDPRGRSAAPTDRLSTPGVEGYLDEEPSYADASCPIATFDLPSTQSQQEPEVVDNEGKGYSKNTVKALSIVRRELQPSADEEDKSLSFNDMADKVCSFSMS